jgi:hypothetical protein
MTQMQQPLPSAWVEKIFARLQGIYGRDFTGHYSTGMVNGIDAGLENAKATWGEELAGFANHPDSIRYALENLPDRVPNCVKFKELCRSAPRPEPLKLEHKISEEQAAENRKKIKEIINGLSQQMSMKEKNK